MNTGERKQQVIDHLAELGAAPKRSLGQNFLIGEHVIQNILTAVEKTGLEEVIEIGPGLGALTEGLIEVFGKIEVLELDTKFSERWRQREGVTVYEGDALKLEWSQFANRSYCLASNLPYQISSSLVVDRSVDPCGADAMVLMFQKEVAQRLKAQPKSKAYGLLTVVAQAAWDITQVTDAGPNEFYPPPNVSSRVLKFTKNRKYKGDWSRFLSLIKAGFSHRRKYLLSNLNSVILDLGSDKAAWVAKLQELGFSEKVRAEELKVSDWIELADTMLP